MRAALSQNVQPYFAHNEIPEPHVLAFRDVTVSRGYGNDRKKLVTDINWTVDEGEHWVILGANGAGKTTLLTMAAAYMHPTRGAITILDEQMGAVDVFELRPRIGLASMALSSKMPNRQKVRDAVITAAWGVTGRWNEEYNTEDQLRATKLMEQWDILKLAHRTYGELSQGERQRTNITRALMTDPELLLLDEPAAGLDVGGREDLLQRISALLSSPTAPTVVMVTHHVEEIASGFTHALLLKNGKVTARGKIDEVINSGNLSEVFNLNLVLTKESGRYQVKVLP